MIHNTCRVAVGQLVVCVDRKKSIDVESNTRYYSNICTDINIIPK